MVVGVLERTMGAYAPCGSSGAVALSNLPAPAWALLTGELIMGTWGTDVFQNDSGADAVIEILKSTHPAALIGAWFDDAVENDYKHRTEAAVASAAVLDYFLNGTVYSGYFSEPYFSADVKRFAYYANEHRTKMKALRGRAVEVLQSIVDQSTDDWQTPEQYVEWKANVTAVIDRLR